MEIFTINSNQVEPGHMEHVTALARMGFGDSSDLERDVATHIASADTLQLATLDDRPVAFAMYRRYLWR